MRDFPGGLGLDRKNQTLDSVKGIDCGVALDDFFDKAHGRTEKRN